MLTSRYRRIVFFFARVVASLIWWELVMPRLGLRAWSERTRSERLQRSAAGFRALAIRLGGVLIKVGQFLSSRLDVLPEVITSELAGLQDEVPPERFADIQRLAEAELGATLAERYLAFETTPLAAASLGQVHRATLPAAEAGAPPRKVVVKVQRPGVELLIATDLAALRTVGGWLKRYPPIRRRADVPALLAEFTRILYNEIDYLAEGRNAESFAANFAGNAGVRVPGIVWTHTTRRVLTLEDVYAIKITDYAAITAAGVSRADVAERLFQTYLSQIFDYALFHADPHPGNLFVEPLEQPAAGGEAAASARPWRLTFIDFGMVGHVPANVKAGLREMFIGVGTRDPARLLKAYQILGVLLPQADLALLERAERRMFERFWGKDMAELRQIDMREMQAFAGEFQELMFAMPFQVPEDLILLGRTVAILSGMCTGLNPQFNVWTGIAPYAQKLIADEASGAGLDFWLAEAGNWVRTVAGLPRQLESALARLERGDVSLSVPRLEAQLGDLNRALRRVGAAVVFAGLLLAGVQLVVAGQTWAGGLGLAGASLAALWMLLLPGRRR
ncbi:MAG: AarF/ABC1/UbiB kinase family protein [Anaerolineales bacterium]|nr:AarF/ABC1/UbiB kinase family protein [Anaerolineales bacterium]